MVSRLAGECIGVGCSGSVRVPRRRATVCRHSSQELIISLGGCRVWRPGAGVETAAPSPIHRQYMDAGS